MAQIVNPRTAIDFETITVGAAAVGLSLSKVLARPLPESALITIESAPFRYRVDGGTATSTSGHLVNIGDIINLDNRGKMFNFSAIRTGGTSATIQVSYER